MKIWSLINEALAGWIAILRGDTGWRDHFRLTPAGLTTALVLYAVVAFLAIGVASFSVGVPNLSGFIAVMVVQALSVVALMLATYGTRMAIPTPAPILDLLVPGTYALIFYLVLGITLSMIGGPLLLFLWLGLAVLLYCLARAAANWTIGVSAAFAALTLVLLVGMPFTLYMLTGPTAAPAL